LFQVYDKKNPNMAFFISDPSSALDPTDSLTDISGPRADKESDMKKTM
jgi:hypothetical protein